MELTNIILSVMGGAYGLMFALMLVMWNSLNKRFDRIENRLEKLDEKLTDIDRRLCRLEGAFASKDCCMIKDSNQMRKAE